MEEKYKERREALVEYVESQGVRNVLKEESLFMRLIGKILFFNRSFMTGFITTIGQTIYWTKDSWESDSAVCNVLPHEFTHAMDFRRMGLIPAALLYLFPQNLALISLGAFGAFYDSRFLWCLLALISLAPWPSWGRKYMEMRGFAVQVAGMLWSDPDRKIDEMPPWILKNFTGPNYYWMWPFSKSLQTQFKQWLTWIEDGTIDEKMPFVKEIRNKIQGV
jgi:hypothetical protein